jgi:signal transduction histidine kinase
MNMRSDTAHATAAERLFAGGGANGATLSAIDWAATPLGPVDGWPQSLRTSLRICLTSKHPIVLWLGPELLKIYNDAYIPIVGQRHPWALGQPGRAVWPEIWDVIGPMLRQVLETGEATWSDDQLLLLERNGYQEECYFTFSYSPIEEESGAVGGVFTAVNETTARVLGERRERLARELAATLVDARSTDDVARLTARVLRRAPNDIPVALLYRLDDTQNARLVATVRLAPGTAMSEAVVPLDGAADGWRLGEAVRTMQPVLVEHVAWGNVAPDVGPELLPHTALTLPVIEPGQNAPTLLLVLEASPRCALQGTYRTFFEQLASHIATALVAAHAFEAQRQRAEALAEIDRAKTLFFSNVSHEFRTPLTLLLGPLADLLAPERDLPPDVRADLHIMHRNGLRLLKLVNTLLDFARIEAGRMHADFVPTDLCILTTDVASVFRSLVEKAGLRLIVECAPMSEMAFVDRDMWEKIILNLLSNAFKFTLQGEIAVRLQQRGNVVELEISDTGIGIPAAEMPHLFERFHRVSGAQARTHEGTGIGLALVQELVHQHGGTISVSSTEGVGSTFTIRMPLGSAHLPGERVGTLAAPSSTALSAAAYVEEAERWLPSDMPGAIDPLLLTTGAVPALLDSAAAPRQARIVLADDNADMRDYLARLLGQHYQVEAVSDGAQALAAIQRAVPDLVLSDVMMPGLDGFALIDRLRAEPRTAAVPVIVLSARAGEEATIEGLQRGADDYLIKPFSAREVLSRVRARLEITRTRQEAQRRTEQALHALLAVLDVMTTGSDRTLSDIADALVTMARDVVGSDIATLVAIDPETGHFIALSTLGRTPEDQASWYATINAHRAEEYFPPENFQRLQAGEVVEVEVQANLARGLPAHGTHALLAAPLVKDGILRGLLTFGYHDFDHRFTATEDALAAGFAQMALAVLDREQLLHERATAQAAVLSLEETTRRMNEFLSIASHELRTPLTSIIANVQMSARTVAKLSDTTAPKVDRLHTLLGRTERQLDRLDRLVGDLLDVSRIAAGKLELRLDAIDLAAILRDTVEGQRAAWPDRRITLSGDRTPTIIQADGDRVGQVITNLVTNALKYSLPSAPVAVSMRAEGSAIRVAVRDHGPGLSEAQQHLLFERFSRVPGITQQSGSGIGLGLGLYICRTIVERHGGTIGVESAPGLGSTFWFTLPVGDPSRADA